VGCEEGAHACAKAGVPRNHAWLMNTLNPLNPICGPQAYHAITLGMKHAASGGRGGGGGGAPPVWETAPYDAGAEDPDLAPPLPTARPTALRSSKRSDRGGGGHHSQNHNSHGEPAWDPATPDGRRAQQAAAVQARPAVRSLPLYRCGRAAPLCIPLILVRLTVHAGYSCFQHVPQHLAPLSHSKGC
jgi:hypothetical protein